MLTVAETELDAVMVLTLFRVALDEGVELRVDVKDFVIEKDGALVALKLSVTVALIDVLKLADGVSLTVALTLPVPLASPAPLRLAVGVILRVSVALTLTDGVSLFTAVVVLDVLTASVPLVPLSTLELPVAVGVTLTVGLPLLLSVTDTESDGDNVADAELEADCEYDSEAETVGRDDADAEVEAEAVRLGVRVTVSVVVLVLVTVAVSDGFCAVRSTIMEAMVVGVPSVPSNVFELPTANTTGVCPDDEIWASLASPLSSKRVHVIVVTPADCEHVTADVPAVECGVMPAKVRASNTYCCAPPPPPGSHITALVFGVPIILLDADIPTPNLQRRNQHGQQVMGEVTGAQTLAAVSLPYQCRPAWTALKSKLSPIRFQLSVKPGDSVVE